VTAVAGPGGQNKLKKLGRAMKSAEELHLMIVLDPFSPPGVGVTLEAGSILPSVIPPDPLTSLWVIPTEQSWGGIRWILGWNSMDQGKGMDDAGKC
jgi:hypothetical protein